MKNIAIAGIIAVLIPFFAVAQKTRSIPSGLLVLGLDPEGVTCL